MCVITVTFIYIVDLGDDLLLESLSDQETYSDAQGGLFLEVNTFSSTLNLLMFNRHLYEERKCQEDEGHSRLSEAH